MPGKETNVEFGKCSYKLCNDDASENFSSVPVDQGLIRTGSLYFNGHRADGKHIPFMLAPYCAAPEEIVSALVKDSEMPLPRIVLFVIAGNIGTPSELLRKLSDKLVKGLVYAMKTTEMWLCTDGLDIGFSRDLGMAFESEISRRMMEDSMLQKVQTSCFSDRALIGICRHDSLSFSNKLGENVTPENEAKIPIKANINKFFDYFIFVKDTTKKQRGENNFILNFAAHLSKHLKITRRTNPVVDTNRFAERVCELPVMGLLLHGEITKIDLVLGHLKLGLPLVIFEGSGGLADILAYAYYQNTHRPDGIKTVEYTEAVLKPQITEQINHLYPDLSEFGISDKMLTAKVIDCIRYSKQQDQQFITVLNISDIEYDPSLLPCHLLRSLFKSQTSDRIKDSSDMKKDLFLAMDWNSADMALTEVFVRDPTNRFEIDSETFFRALVKPQRESFVRLFLDQGFRVHKFLDSSTLMELFQNSLHREFFRSVVWENYLGFTPNVEITRRFLDSTLTILLEELTGVPCLINSYDLDWNFRDIYDDRTPEEAERKAIAILILWAVLSYRVNLAKAIWSHSEQPIHLALVCSIILRRLEVYVTDMGLQNEMDKLSKEFSIMAYGIMTKCYDSVPCRALCLLREKCRVWSYKAVVEIAAHARNRTFLAHSCCQKYLDNLFMGYIKVRELPYGDMTISLWLKIVLSAFLIFPIYLWIKYDIPCKVQKASCENVKSENAKSNKKPEITASMPHIIRTFQSPRIWSKIYYLWTAPITKFWTFHVFYLLFLICFSLAVMWPSCGSLYLDFLTCLWIATIIMDSAYHAYSINKRYTSMTLVYKCLEISIMLIFLLGYVTGRVVRYHIIISPYSAKIMLCIALLYFYYRLIFTALPISSELGPMLYRVKRMTAVDFTNFMRVTILVIISNGIIIHSTLYPDYPLSVELLRRAFYDALLNFFLVPSYETYGSPDPQCIELFRHPNKRSFIGLPNATCQVGRYLRYYCPNPGVWPYIFGVQYLIILRLILTTMLFALFSNTQRRLKEEGTYIWRYQRYELIVNFSHRLALPPPLCILSLIYITIEALHRWIYKIYDEQSEDYEALNENDYAYWKSLAREHYDEISREEPSQVTTRKRMEKMKNLVEALNYQRKLLRDLEGSLGALEIEIANAHKYLIGTGLQVSVRERLNAKHVPQIFSRMSPYPNTMISRYPVSDNHVPWHCEWTVYDPIAFTLHKEDYPNGLQDGVDVDIQLKRETEGEDFQMPLFMWNDSSFSPGGVYVDRQSWITSASGAPFKYELDSESLPKNPIGRTGLKGRGCLLRWGPNHYIYLVITRWQEMEEISWRQYLEVIVMKSTEGLSLPGGYVSDVNRYKGISSLFESKETWTDSTDMVELFESLKEQKARKMYPLRRRSSGGEKKFSLKSDFYFERVKRGYMDEEVNTDQAWCEAEVWHFHYNVPCTIDEKLKDKMFWTIVNEDILLKLPIGQAAILHTVAKKMKAVLEVL